MIKCNLAEILARKGLKIKDVANHTGISRTTLTALNYNQGKGVQFDTMDQICSFLDITPGELFTHYSFNIEVTEVMYTKVDGVYYLDCEFHLNSEVYTGIILCGYQPDSATFMVTLWNKLLSKLEVVPNDVIVRHIMHYYNFFLRNEPIPEPVSRELVIYDGDIDKFLEWREER
jgi:DNA-binding Xre family transcriptional regulator